MVPSTDPLRHPVAEFVRPVQSALNVGLTVNDALANIRQRSIEHAIIYFYVVDDDNRVVGVVPTRRLLLANPDHHIRELMVSPVVTLTSDATLAEGLELFARHHLLALPVVDHDGHLVGALDVQLYTEEAAELGEVHRQSDLFQLIGMRLETLRQRSPWRSYRARMPWLVCNMVGGTLCAVIGAIFEDVLAAVVLLAMFIPLVLTLSESISMQSTTIGLQLLHGEGIRWKYVGARLKIDLPTTIMIGLTSGVAIGVLSMGWGEGVWPSLVIGGSIAISMVLSALIGLACPVLLHAGKLDPRFAAGPLALTLSDVVTTTCYLGMGTIVLL